MGMAMPFTQLANAVRQQKMSQPRPMPQPITPNRYTRTRVRPIGPITQRPTNPAITNPNARLVGGPAPIQQPPVAQPGGPFVGRPDLGPGVGFGPGLPPPTQQPSSLPSFVTPPPEGSINTQVLTPITNPATGETYTAPTGGYTLNPNQQPGGPFTPTPGFGPDVGFGPGLPPPQLEAQPYISNTVTNPNASIGFGPAPITPPGGKSSPASQQPMTSAPGTPPGFVPSWQMAGYNSLDEWKAATGGQGQGQIGFGPAPVSGGFNPMAGNTTLPGNF